VKAGAEEEEEEEEDEEAAQTKRRESEKKRENYLRRNELQGLGAIKHSRDIDFLREVVSASVGAPRPFPPRPFYPVIRSTGRVEVAVG
jgi:hypothetical protein